MDDAQAELISRDTRSHTPRIDYEQESAEFGAGNSGAVFRARNIGSREIMAVKIMRRPNEESHRERWKKCLKREVENLSSASHSHIVQYIGSQGWDMPEFEIFMELMKGNLKELGRDGVDRPVASLVSRHILQALDYLACKDIMHRDVKPENILYDEHPDGQYIFKLADFGCSCPAIEAKSIVGDERYRAPEIARQLVGQSCKADVWSLYVTLLWILDGSFRTCYSWEEQEEMILRAASTSMSEFREMAIEDPVKRASAAQMLVKLYMGAGLSTPRDQVPAMGTASVHPAFTLQWIRNMFRRVCQHLWDFGLLHLAPICFVAFILYGLYHYS
ncbi:hypothetical protein B7494_g8493 [Chlorociboria aeruginascens]|nr:hypothetical protein B7494_g8493 [Chlorociboria aeruginascens]